MAQDPAPASRQNLTVCRDDAGRMKHIPTQRQTFLPHARGPSVLRLLLAACTCVQLGCGEHRPAEAPSPPSPPIHVPTQIVSPSLDGSENELFERGERALLGQRWREAADIFETLLRVPPSEEKAPTVLFDLGASYEGLELRERARDRFRE